MPIIGGAAITGGLARRMRVMLTALDDMLANSAQS